MLPNSSLQEGILTQNSLQYQDLQALLTGELLALRIPLFYAPEHCLQLLASFQGLPLFGPYRMAKDMQIHRIGMSLFETENQPEYLHRYYKDARDSMKKLSLICYPLTNPLTQLHEQLHELWPHGAQVENLHGFPMQQGIVRLFEAGKDSGLPPHYDLLQNDVPDSPRAAQQLTQLAANIYLQVPDEGGELDLWDFQPTQQEFEELCTGHHDFMDRSLLPPKAATLRPQTGELILMQSSKVHSVRPSYGTRLSMACFVGYYGQHEPLTYWV
ncbi:MAG: 2OG-Fe(II) oxygenase [Bacteroidota bacterium]